MSRSKSTETLNLSRRVIWSRRINSFDPTSSGSPKSISPFPPQSLNSFPNIYMNILCYRPRYLIWVYLVKQVQSRPPLYFLARWLSWYNLFEHILCTNRRLKKRFKGQHYDKGIIMSNEREMIMSKQQKPHMMHERAITWMITLLSLKIWF